MSNKISRRTFLKCTGASAAALGAAAMLGGCGSSTSDAIEVKVGDKVSNWNNLGVQLTSVFTMSTTPDLPDHEYVAVLITAVNRSGATTLLSVLPCMSKLLCRTNKRLPFTGRTHHRFNNTGVANGGNRFAEKVFAIGKTISGSGQLQLFCRQATDTLAIHR